MKKILPNWCGIFLLSALTLAGCDKEEEVDPTIASIAVSNPDFQVLEDAAIRGGVAGVLSNKNPNDPTAQGNFTVFAPNNAAFARLGLNSAADLLNLQKNFLTNTLLYHVANGTIAGGSLQMGSTSASALVIPAVPATATTPATPAIPITRRIIRRGGDSYVNGSRILTTDVLADNGTIHVIDKVLLATGGNVVQSAQALESSSVFTSPELTFLVEAVKYCGLVSLLSDTQGLTVFAPTDQAFKNLGADLGVPLNVPADIRKLPKDVVTAVLATHVLATGAKFTPELPDNTTVSSFGGAPLQLGVFSNGVLTVKGANNATPANMVIPDVQATNGIVHVIDRVLRP
ncbi:fasciclin domain-containing protein [Hymenobacter tibetensis]|uniref:Fasciclin domain-containing protein n=1 Tax=Hymenobacter tibetensis TaxID=497967 RepID=A0ABY4CU01_9BACT|nr:fasciclin domain-containing protein [Hymenobacter tibetensis]UOG73746.1 fasciclin domain-containing protein [Hymenobacter tibetensis]